MNIFPEKFTEEETETKPLNGETEVVENETNDKRKDNVNDITPEH